MMYLLHKLIGCLAVVLVAAMIAVSPASAAPPSLASEHLDALHRKTLEEYDSEVARRGIVAVDEARNEFANGLTALGGYDFTTARAAFERARRSAATYAATFNEALTNQILRSYATAQELYGEAAKLEPTDVERETNLALGFAAQRQFEQANKAFQGALALVPPGAAGAASRGRVLLQLALYRYRNESRQSGVETLALAGAAFAEAQDERGQTVVAGKTGIATCAQGQNAEGERLLLAAIARLQALGAALDEAAARTDLVFYCYVAAADRPKIEPQITRSIEIAERTGHMLQLGRSLNAFGIARAQQDRIAEAIDLYARSFASFQRAQDLMGQGEAGNNLGIAYLKSHQDDLAFQAFDQSVGGKRRGRGVVWSLANAL
jgi:tetratricopeptide (TPR) repeat protein